MLVQVGDVFEPSICETAHLLRQRKEGRRSRGISEQRHLHSDSPAPCWFPGSVRVQFGKDLLDPNHPSLGRLLHV